MSSFPTSFSYLTAVLEEAVSQLDQLKVSELKVVARSCSLPLSGRKADIRDRIVTFLNNALKSTPMDQQRIVAVKFLIRRAMLGDQVAPTFEVIHTALENGQSLASLTPALLTNNAASVGQSSSQNNYSGTSAFKTTTLAALPSSSSGLDVTFKQAPFYKLKRLIKNSIISAPKNIHGRGTVQAKFFLSQEELDLLLEKEKFKLFLFSADRSSSNKINVDIKFPHPLEIKMNNNVVKDNIRGFKSKPGTAKPANVTPFTFINTARQNILSIIYACTSINYVLCLYIVEVITPLDIVNKQILTQSKISKASTLKLLKEMLQEEEDDEMVTTSMVLSLQCPISYCRMKYPTRSIYCKHLQCFDAQWFLESQQQVPTWVCPVCQRDIKIEDLGLCEYVEEIIQASNDETEQIELNVDGSWTVLKEDEDDNFSDGEEKKPVISSLSEETRSNEPVVISLDSSDEEDNDETETRGIVPVVENAEPYTLLDSVSPQAGVADRNVNENGHPNNIMFSPPLQTSSNTSPTAPSTLPRTNVVDVTSDSAHKNNTNTSLGEYGQLLDTNDPDHANSSNIASSPSPTGPQDNGSRTETPNGSSVSNQVPHPYRYPIYANGVETSVNYENSSIPISQGNSHETNIPNSNTTTQLVESQAAKDSNTSHKENHGKTTTGVAQRRRAPVSIFIPRKHYSTIIPQKRHVPEHAPTQQSDIIDLTSDD